MSVVSDSVRLAITLRAASRCEYCHVPTRGQVATFPIDHILPVSAGGTDIESNLALACPHCNAHKWAAIEGFDQVTRKPTRLFNPRLDFWSEHFAWSTIDLGELLPNTAMGRVTADRLQMNEPTMVELRQLLAELGLFPELSGRSLGS